MTFHHAITVTRVSPNQLTPATELCVTALWAQQRAAVRSINNISRGGYITLEVLNILSNLFNFLMAKLLKRSSYTAIRSISIVVRVVRNNLQGSQILHLATMSCSHFWQVNHCSCFSSAPTFFLFLYLQKFAWPHSVSVHDGDGYGCLLGVPAGWDGHGSWYMDMERDGDKF